MAEEQERPEMGTEEQPTTAMEDGNRNDAPQSVEALQKELDDIRAALKKANGEAAKYRKQASAYEDEEQKRKDAELSEMERLQKQLADERAKTQRLQRETLQRRVAAEMGLPEALALRLQGDDAETMKADAETILSSLPKPTPPKVQPTNPSNAQPPTETDAQRRARIHSGGQPHSNGFDPTNAAKYGGGVVWAANDKEN